MNTIAWEIFGVVVALIAISTALKLRDDREQTEDPQTLRQYLGLDPDTTLDDLMSEDES